MATWKSDRSSFGSRSLITGLSYLFVSLLLSASSQVFQKSLALEGGISGISILYQWKFLAGLLALFLGLLFWLKGLSIVDLHVAYSLLSINYVLILLIGKILFKEDVPLTRWLGSVLIISGVSLIVLS